MMDSTAKARYLIRIVDDDAAVLKGLDFLLTCRNWRIKTYQSAKEFLEKDDQEEPGCLLLDVRMPEISGIELQKILLEQGSDIPIIVVTGHADLDTAIRVLKKGAVDFLQKPVEVDKLERALEEAIAKCDLRRSGLGIHEIVQIYHDLSEREQGILHLVAQGLTSKIIGERLGLSERTVQGHRLNLSKKFKVHSAQELQACYELIRKTVGKKRS